MPNIHNITFNAQREAADKVLPDMLRTPEKLFGLLSRPTGDAAAAADADDSKIENRGTLIAADWSAETAARNYLQILLENQGSEQLRAITSPERPQVIPDLKMRAIREEPLTGTQTVSFQQTSKSIPIFGMRATVELDGETRKLVSVDGMLTDVPDIAPMAALSQQQALDALAKFGGKSAASITPDEAPLLNFYLDGTGGENRWRLVYLMRKVPMAPPLPPADSAHASPPSNCGYATPFSTPEYDYLVDGNSGDVVFYSSATAHLDVPVDCVGKDAGGEVRKFSGLPLGDGDVILTDPLRNLATYDYGQGDISAGSNFPAMPVRNKGSDFATAAPAAVSAHFYATQVFDFYNDVLKRNGVDGKGMKLESVVNCYSSAGNKEPSPIWRNASWWKDRMWYGQMPDGNGNNITMARFYDIVAHEITHGVTANTAGLWLRDQPGALNESFSDIFGTIISNWFPQAPNPVSGWNWTIGAGWNGSGTILRSMKDPTMGGQQGKGQPAHMKDFVKLPSLVDGGGIHTNSGIHNKAAYNLLTSVDGTGKPVIPAEEVAILYYLTLTRLVPMSTFSDCRRVLLSRATSMYSFKKEQEQQEKLTAIAQAYDSVGIV